MDSEPSPISPCENLGLCKKEVFFLGGISGSIFTVAAVVVVVVVVVVGCWLLVVGCWLLVVGCWLLVVGCWLLVVGCWLLVVGVVGCWCCWLLVVGCWLLVVGCWLLVVGCWLLVVGCWLLVGLFEDIFCYKFSTTNDILSLDTILGVVKWAVHKIDVCLGPTS